MPTTPTSCSAFFTPSRRCGRMMLSIFFIGPPWKPRTLDLSTPRVHNRRHEGPEHQHQAREVGPEHEGHREGEGPVEGLQVRAPEVEYEGVLGPFPRAARPEGR